MAPRLDPGLRRGDSKIGESGTKFFLTIVLLCDTYPPAPPNWGPAHDGELGRGGGQACGCGVTCATLPGAQEETRGHYDPRASGKATCSMGTVRKRSSKGLRPAGCGRCSALYRWSHKDRHTAPGSARPSHFSLRDQSHPRKGETARPQSRASLQVLAVLFRNQWILGRRAT